MRYTRSNFKKWLQKMPPDSRPFSDTLCPIASYLGMWHSALAVGVDKALVKAIDDFAGRDESNGDYCWSKLTPRKILSIIKRLEK